jgi:RNA polymerase sigma factor (sigma-70 family)
MAHPEWLMAIGFNLHRLHLYDPRTSRPYPAKHSATQRIPPEADEASAVPCERGPDLVAPDEALNALAEIDPRQSRIVGLRFFGGLGVEEVAEALRISRRTVVREWNSARARLYHELNGGHKDESSR